MLTVKKPSHRLLYGALVALAAVGIRATLQSALGNDLHFAVAFPAVVLVSVLWGVAPGLLAAAICAAAATALQNPSPLPAPAFRVQLAVFLLGCIVISVACGALAKRRDLDASSAPHETPLGSWLRVVLWAAFLIPLAFFVGASWWAYDRAERDATDAVAHGADLAYEHALRTFTVAAEVARRAAEVSNGDGDSVRAHEAEIHQRLMDMATGVPAVVNLSVWDAEGALLTRSDAFPVDHRANVSDRAYFQEQKVSPDVLGVSPVMKGRLTGAELINTTVRRLSADKTFQGMVSASLTPEYFRNYYHSLAKEQPTLASFALMRTDGQTLARWPRGDEDAKQVSKESPVYQQIQAGIESGSVALPRTKTREARIASFKRLPGFPVYVVAGVSRDAMFAGWVRFEALLAAVLFPTAAGLTYVTWVALNKTRREAATAKHLQEQIRRRGEAERAMLESQKFELLGLVTAGVAHDFNNLLAIVGSSVYTLKRKFPEVAQTKQLDAMDRAMASGVRLTRQLLSFTRKQALKPETIQLQSWLPGTENLVKTTIGPNIAWELKVDADTRSVTVDTAELELAIINLVVNARHAMPNGGLVTVHASNADASHGFETPMVLICVKDTGVGIPPENLSRIFEPFFTTRAKGAGSGLGLGQVQGFCAQAQGTVRVTSTVDEGTTACIYLPGGDTVALEDAPATTAQAPLTGTVLLVEDNEDVASTTAQMLREAGLTVARSPSADTALSYLNTGEMPDAVLSDIAMPGMDGIAFAFLLRERFPSLPILLTTGYADRLEQAVAGGLRVLPKPVAPADMLAELRAALASRADRANEYAFDEGSNRTL